MPKKKRKKRYKSITDLDGGILAVRKIPMTKHEISALQKHRQWLRCLDYFRDRCAYCLSKPLVSEGSLTKDHFIPKSLGGTGAGTNIVPACSNCNSIKNDRHPNNWCNEEQLERVYTYFWDFRIRVHSKNKHLAVWKAIGLGE